MFVSINSLASGGGISIIRKDDWLHDCGEYVGEREVMVTSSLMSRPNFFAQMDLTFLRDLCAILHSFEHG